MTKVDEQKLKDSDFINRFLLLTKEYDDTFDTVVFSSAQKWANEKSYDSIKYFLMPSTFDNMLPFSKRKFVEMDIEELLVYQSTMRIVLEILDKKEQLYHELITYYSND